jgi:hypothetical protein
MAGYDFNIEQEPNLLSNLELAAHQDLVPIRIEVESRRVVLLMSD